jgi:hypothetical protein
MASSWVAGDLVSKYPVQMAAASNFFLREGFGTLDKTIRSTSALAVQLSFASKFCSSAEHLWSRTERRQD